MKTATLHPDATRCPDCRSTLAGTGTCPACGLALSGPAAARLWEVDTELLHLDRARDALLSERSGLLAQLRATAPVTSAPGLAAATPEESPKRVQDVLLLLGGLLLAGAGLVFAAVTYEQLGATGRALVLVALTLAAGAAAPRLRARGLRSTAETVGAVALVLAALDAYGLRTLGLAQDSSPLSYAAASAAVLAAGAAGYARAVPLRTVQCAAVALAQLPVPLLLVREDASAAAAGLWLALLVGADLGVLAARGSRLPRPVHRALQAAAVLGGAAAVLCSLSTVLPLSGPLAPSLLGTATDRALAAAALVACAAALVGAGALAPAGPPRSAATAAAVPLLALAAHAVLPDVPTALVLAAAGLLVAGASLSAPATWRTGALGGAVLVATASVLLVAAPALQGLLLPVTWVLDPWSRPAGRSARESLAPGLAWDGSLTTPAVLLVAALTLATAGRHLRLALPAALPAPLADITRVKTSLVHASRVDLLRVAAGVLGTGAVALLPLALDLSYAAALALLLLLAVSLAAAAAVLGPPRGEGPVRPDDVLLAPTLAGAAAAVVLLAVAWSTAAEGATLALLPLAALVLAGLSALPLAPAPVTVGLAGALVAAEVAAVGASFELAADQVGASLLVPVAALLALAPALDTRRGRGAEGAAGATAVAALALTSSTVGWLSWTLAGLGVLALATAVRPDRRGAAPLGGLLLSASSWVRLADAGVSAPEPYVLPLAALALVLGHLRRREEPETTSWAAYGLGLSLALVPSLLRSFDDTDLTRPLLVGLAALAVLLVGARSRLRAPLVVGGAVLLVDALQLLGPYAAALPRWLSLGGVGALLLLVGATYEQRRQDVSRLREHFDALT